MFGSSCTVYCDPGRIAWKPRAKVGVIVRKHHGTKGIKVYLYHEKLVVTTLHFKNVQTMGVDENQHLQEHLHQKYSSYQDTQYIEDVAQRKEIQAIGRKVLGAGIAGERALQLLTQLEMMMLTMERKRNLESV